MKRLIATCTRPSDSSLLQERQNNPQSSSANPLPPVQPPPDMDTRRPPSPLPPEAKDSPPLIPLANSDARGPGRGRCPKRT